MTETALQAPASHIYSKTPQPQGQTNMADIDKISDDTYMSVTEAMALAGEVMDSHQSETLLVVSLAGEGDNAILGGELTTKSLASIRELLDELEAAATCSPGVVHTSR